MLDRVAVKLEIHVSCEVENNPFAPPLRIKISGCILAGELNSDRKENKRTVWWNTPVRKNGPDSKDRNAG